LASIAVANCDDAWQWPDCCFEAKSTGRLRDVSSSAFEIRTLPSACGSRRDTVKLMCAALIPRWELARVAEQLERESASDFGRS